MSADWPPSLKRWLQKSLVGLSGSQTTQGQQELKAVVKAVMDNKAVWNIEWDEQLAHKVGDVQGTVQRLLAVSKQKLAPLEVASAPAIPPRYVAQASAPAASYASMAARGTSHQPAAHGYSTIPTQQHYYHSQQQQQGQLSYPTVHPFHQQSYPPQPPEAHHHSYAAHQGYQAPNYAQPPHSHVSSYQPHVPEHREPIMKQSGWDSKDDGTRYWQKPQPAQAISPAPSGLPRTSLVGTSKWGPATVPPPSLETRDANDHSGYRSTTRETDDSQKRTKRPRKTSVSSSASSASHGSDEDNDDAKANHRTDAGYVEVAKALRTFMVKNGEKSFPVTDLSRFYKEYPEHRDTLKGHVKGVVASPGSGLSVKKHTIKLTKGLSKTLRSSLPTPSRNDDTGSESPSRKAARAARFGNDVVQVAQASSYEKITLESQRVAAAFENAERTGGEVDWDSLVLRGTCRTLEKPFLRLTAPPDPSTVRPEPILVQALEMVLGRLKKEGKTIYSWASDQLKSIRQDLRVQHIQNEFTVRVYEAHARAALQYGAPDFQEFNQCSTQGKDLYAAGLGQEASKQEFAGYLLLYHVYCKARYRYPSSFITLSLCNPSNPKDLTDPEAHAHALDIALDSFNWIRFFRLYNNAPNLGTDLLAPVARYARVTATRMCCTAGKTVPKALLFNVLSFENEDEWDGFCFRFKLVFADDQKTVLDGKPCLQALNEALAEGSIWT